MQTKFRLWVWLLIVGLHSTTSYAEQGQEVILKDYGTVDMLLLKEQLEYQQGLSKKLKALEKKLGMETEDKKSTENPSTPYFLGFLSGGQSPVAEIWYESDTNLYHIGDVIGDKLLGQWRLLTIGEKSIRVKNLESGKQKKLPMISFFAIDNWEKRKKEVIAEIKQAESE